LSLELDLDLNLITTNFRLQPYFLHPTTTILLPSRTTPFGSTILCRTFFQRKAPSFGHLNKHPHLYLRSLHPDPQQPSKMAAEPDHVEHHKKKVNLK
jgi:hypothetical protein